MYADINTAKISIDGRECNVGFFTDITERRRAEQALQKAHDELEIRVKQRTSDLARANQQLLSLASELSLAEERLRRRIATNVHDHIGQNLAISKIKLQSLRESVSSPKLTALLDEIRELIGQTIESSRSLTFELSPPVLYELGFEAAVEWLVRNTRQKHGLLTDFQSDRRPKPLSFNVRVLLFQAVRELLVNIAKHANARNVTVCTRRVDDQVQVTVEDDGVGFDTSRLGSHTNQTEGFGLFSIRERLGYIGGSLDVDSRPGLGTRVTLVTPIEQESENDKEKNK
jgi:signal transduction histidine kinase